MYRKRHILTLIAALLFFCGNLAAQANADSSASERNHLKYELIASPNPFEDEVTLTITTGNKNLIALRIFDLIGKEVAYYDLRNKQGEFRIKVNFAELTPSVYFCNVYGANGIIESKKLFRTK